MPPSREFACSESFLDPSEARVVEDIRNHLKARSVDFAGAGGSPAKVLRVVRGDGSVCAVKYLLGAEGRVDGHDLATFRQKPQQSRKTWHERPGLRPFCAEIIDDFEGDDWAAYVMPFYPGAPMTHALLEPDADLDDFFVKLAHIVQILVEQGYAVDEMAPPPTWFDAAHLDRVARRLPLLESELSSDLFDADLSLNGRPCPPVHAMLAHIRSHETLLQILKPPHLRFPVHGDLILGNILVEQDSKGSPGVAFRMLDPRGTLDAWDPLYDAAKMLFSVFSYERGVEGGFRIDPSNDAGYRFRLGAPLATYTEAAARFVPFLEGHGAWRTLCARDPGWRWRFWFTHAFHHIAESACRLSDRKQRTPEEFRNLARGFFLTGRWLLADLLERFERDEPPASVGELRIW